MFAKVFIEQILPRFSVQVHGFLDDPVPPYGFCADHVEGVVTGVMVGVSQMFGNVCVSLRPYLVSSRVHCCIVWPLHISSGSSCGYRCRCWLRCLEGVGFFGFFLGPVPE